MSKEKMHIYSDVVPVNPGDYQSALKSAMAKLSKQKFEDIVLALSDCDLQTQFLFVARIVPLSMNDTITLLEKVIEVAVVGDDIADTDTQIGIAKVCDALLEKAEEFITEKDLLGAACICFAIIRSIEPQITKAGDDGELLQVIIGDAFELLAKLPQHSDDRQQFSLLALMAHSVWTDTAVAHRNHDDQWKEIVNQYMDIQGRRVSSEVATAEVGRDPV